jgi:transposase
MPPLCAPTSIAPGREKNGPQAIGRSRGGLTTKIHALVDALGNPVELMLTPGQDHDLTCAEPLIENADPRALLRCRSVARHPRATRDHPSDSTQGQPKSAARCDYALYCERNLIERFFNKLKHFRAIATRYDKNWPGIFLPGFSWLPLLSSSTEDRP